ncbi:unnamed protein product (macronuclear) [Paramecium tetraurelia]|uniref:Transmembrane protein n=1 Tax=Paramecium tetraurelia TaxID=5888 RepID=A0DN50_PARTE|nr:uncharacterized protein GSPATT00018672001 [Paramecium tetraurelia]CAK84467.1 unnamed protein product [Paramecium tetraurelia]|eukprot:XP_001451864.1 hypothetical protein (macronuclear) [Paramecium tetraurelia strain d4-2]
MKFLLILVGCQLAVGLKIHYLATKCPCSEFSKQNCDASKICSWNGEDCQDLDCQQLSQSYCFGDLTNYKCRWDKKFEVCKEFDYDECDQMIDAQDCIESIYYNKISCSWTNQMKCEQFDCSIDTYCPSWKCSKINGICSNPTIELNCSALAIDQCGSSYNGFGIKCYQNDFVQCKSLDQTQFSCSQLNDSKTECQNNLCIYENNKCRDKECTDLSKQQECEQFYSIQSKYLTSCFWTGYQCEEVQEEDLEEFNKDDCQKKTFLTYSWSEDDQCQKCVLFEENESDQVLPIVLGITIPISILLILTCIMIWWCKKKQKFCFKPDQKKSYEDEIQKDEKKSSDNNFTQRLKHDQTPAL